MSKYTGHIHLLLEDLDIYWCRWGFCQWSLICRGLFYQANQFKCSQGNFYWSLIHTDFTHTDMYIRAVLSFDHELDGIY